MRIDLDTLLGLLFFVVFFVLPVLSRARSKQPPQGRTGAPSPGRTASAPTASGGSGGASNPRPSAMGGGRPQAGTASQGTPTQGAPPPDSPLAMLEEIRRRVQEAQERERAGKRQAGQPDPTRAASAPRAPASRPAANSAGAPAGRGLVSSDPFERGLVSGEPRRPPPASALGREGRTTATVTADPLRVERLPARRKGTIEGPEAPAARRATQAPADKRRRDAGLGARLGALGLDRLDRATVLHGLVWHEILDEPAAYRRLRRQRSRPR